MRLSKRNNITVQPYTKTSKYFESIIGTEDAEKECNNLEDIFKGNTINKILDFGCGTGLHSIILGERGYKVTGVDISKEMIDIAYEKTNYRKTPNVKFVNIDIHYLMDAEFNACISMWNVIGYITEKDKLIQVFKDIRERLKVNSLFIIDTFNGVAVNKIGPNYTFKDKNIGKERVVKIAIPKYDPLYQLLYIKFKYFVFKNNKFEEEIDEIHKMRVYMPLEIDECLKSSGFKLEKITSVENYPNEPKETEWDVRYIARAI